MPFLETNVGKYPSLQVDCITPFPGTKDDMVKAVCVYLSGIVTGIVVVPNITQNTGTESNAKGMTVNYLVLQIKVQNIII